MSSDCTEEVKAYCLFASYISMVLLHIQPDGLPDLRTYNRYLPKGIQLYTIYILAHNAYLQGEYAKALGMAQSALILSDRDYPISMIYLQCIIAMLACRDWTNHEIADYLDLSVNTVKNYVSGILEKLHVNKRDKLKEYVNQ